MSDKWLEDLQEMIAGSWEWHSPASQIEFRSVQPHSDDDFWEYGEKGKVIADFKLEDLLTAKEIESIPRTVTMRGWHDKGIAEFEDRSFGYDELVIRMKHKGWSKVIRISLSSGKIVKE